MLALLYLFAGLLMGYVMAGRMSSSATWLVRLWVAVVIALTGMMWCVVPFAAVFGFTALAHACALVLLAVLLRLGSRLFGPSTPTQESGIASWTPIYVMSGLIALMIGLLMYGQTLYPKNGGLYAGISTYGDLSFHLGLITNMVQQQALLLEYPIFPGARLTYPFLPDALSASLHLLGLPLRWSVLLPGFLMTFAVVAGFSILAVQLTRRAWTAVLAAGLFFFNGGFTFFFLFRDTWRQWQFTPGFLRHLLSSPVVWAEHNIHMWNIISAVLIPQRTSLAGWMVLFFILWLLTRFLQQKRTQELLLAGIMTGLLPMVHTVSYFVALVCALVWAAVYGLTRREHKIDPRGWWRFFVPAAVLGLPQILWMMPAAAGSGFLRWHFNWANEQDFWLWFWIKNGGVVFLLVVPAFLFLGQEWRRFYSPAIILFVVGETVLIGVWPPDNNKILFVWLAFSVILVSQYAAVLFKRLGGRVVAKILVGVVVVTGMLSGLLVAGQGFMASYELFSPAQLRAAEFIQSHTPADALFLSSGVHNHPVSVLAGRRILCGYDGWLWSHGIDYGTRKEQLEQLFRHPGQIPVFDSGFKIDYVYLGGHERQHYAADPDEFRSLYPQVYSRGGVHVYAVSQRAVEQARGTAN